MKLSRVIALVLLGVFVLNFASWAIIGRSHTLALAAHDFDGYGTLDGNDTLHMYAYYNLNEEQKGDWRDPGDLSVRARERLALEFVRQHTASRVEYHDRALTALPDSLPPKHFILGIGFRSLFPLHVEVVAMVYTPGFVSARTRDWMWIFGWRPIGLGSHGVS